MTHKTPTRKQILGGAECRRCYDPSEEGPGDPGEFPCRRWHLNGTFQNAEFTWVGRSGGSISGQGLAGVLGKG